MESEVNGTSIVKSNTQSVGDLKQFFQNLTNNDVHDADQVTSGGSPPRSGKPAVPPKPALTLKPIPNLKENVSLEKPPVPPKGRSLSESRASPPDNGEHVKHNNESKKQTQPSKKPPVLPKQRSLPESCAGLQVHDKHNNNEQSTEDAEQNHCQTNNGGQKEDNGEEGSGDDDDDNGDNGSDFDSDSDSDQQQTFNRRESMIIFQSLEGIPDLEFLDHKQKKLYNIAKEILTTEITYVGTLKLLHEVFYFTLDLECRAKGIIPAEALLEIFSNVMTIHQFHRDFLLPKLEERMKKWIETPRVGDIFNFLAPFLKMYTEYVKNFDQAMTSLAKWKLKSPKFASLIENIQKTKECGNLTLEHHMLAPVQRVPRYKLLLKDYVSKLDEDSPDLQESQKALEIIGSAANHANESMKKTERFQKMLEIQEKFGDGTSIVTASREFITEGELVKISQRNAQPMSRTIVLFNDLIYYCSKIPATGKYKVHRTAELVFAHVEEAEEEIPNRELMFRVRSKRQITDFLTTSVEQREEWVETLKTAITNAVDKNNTFGRNSLAETDLGKIAPLWVKDSAVSMCMECSQEFTTLKRRHHCRACGRIVCGGCSAYRAPLEYDDNKVNRVCLNCHKVLVPEGSESAEQAKNDAKARKKSRRVPSKKSVCADSMINGYFNFRSEHAKTWTKRWCSLGVDFTIYVFKAKMDRKTQATIPLPGFNVEEEHNLETTEKSNGNHVFVVSHPAFGWYMFDADSEETAKRWVEYISYAVKAEVPPMIESESTPLPNST